MLLAANFHPTVWEPNQWELYKPGHQNRALSKICSHQLADVYKTKVIDEFFRVRCRPPSGLWGYLKCSDCHRRRYDEKNWKGMAGLLQWKPEEMRTENAVSMFLITLKGTSLLSVKLRGTGWGTNVRHKKQRHDYSELGSRRDSERERHRVAWGIGIKQGFFF